MTDLVVYEGTDDLQITSPTEDLILHTEETSSVTVEVTSFGAAPASHGDLSGLVDDDHTQYPLISSGSGAPASTPGRVGEIYIDTTADEAWVAIGTASSSDWKQATGAGGGDAFVGSPLSQFAATTSAQLAGVLSDETGSGLAVFNNAPTFIAPVLGTIASGDGSALTGTAAGLTAGATTGVEAGADVTDAANVAAAGAPIISSGAGAPGSTPSAVGDIYVDTTADEVYVAAGVASSADWKNATAASPGDMAASTYDPATIAEQLVGLTATQTLSNKTLVAPALGTIASGDGSALTGTAAGLTVGATTGVEAGADVTDAANVAGAGAPIISSGAGSPASTPSAVGDIYVDTTANTGWIAAGTASSADWKQATGAGGGDLLAANNLSDVAIAATAFANIKQAASATATGVVELATIAEVDTGTDTARAITPAGLAGSALQTKVAGVETAADVTDGVNVGAANWAAAAKATPIDADTIVLADTAAVNVIKKTTWTQVKAFLKTYFDGLYATTAQGSTADSALQPAGDGSSLTGTAAGLTVGATTGVEAGADVTDAVNVGAAIAGAAAKSAIVDADSLGTIDSEAANVLKETTFTQLKAFLKTYFDTLYNLYVHPNHSGDVTSTADGATVIGAGKVTAAMRAAAAVATAAQFRSKTASVGLDADIVYAAAAEVTLTDAVTIAVDMDTFINAVVTLGGNRTLGNPTNLDVGQSGYIRIVQDGTGSRTLAYGTSWEFADGTAPVLTTTASVDDVLHYEVMSATRVLAVLTQAPA